MNLNLHLKSDICSMNRKPAHTPLSAYENVQQARASGQSAYKISLNGEYDFCIYDKPEDVPEFYLPDFTFGEDGSKITVPGNWELQFDKNGVRFGEPIYTNIPYPWEYLESDGTGIRASERSGIIANPPYIPEKNPTGCYRKSFTLPANFDLDTRDVTVYFEGVETAYYLWINGNFVGYSEDSKLPSEFDITQYLKEGENVLAVMVVRFATSAYLEDQDYWHISGITRNVSLISKPKLHIGDYKISAIPDLVRLCGEVSVDVKVAKVTGYADCKVKVSMYDGDTLICEGVGGVNVRGGYRNDSHPTSNTARIKLAVDEVKLWSTESPKLYRLVMALTDKDGNVLDVEASAVGFKKLELKDGVLYLNGNRLIVRGVNRHEHYPHGRNVPREWMIDEIRQMKKMNINSVRTCHYPDVPLWYDLCDELGILLICECNLETHGVEGELSHLPQYAPQYVERAMRMVETHKNHVSVYSWSLGNESGYGAPHAAMYGFIKEYDKDRLCQYEAGLPPANVSDIRGNMYATIDNIERMLGDPSDDRPIILVEFLYQISNSGGGMNKFYDLVKKYPRFQGGYIWDWQDKCLTNKTASGEEFFAYGGDFNESLNDNTNPYYMTNNGIVRPDLAWKPVAYEVKEAYAPVRVTKPKITSPWQTSISEREYYFMNDTDTKFADDFDVKVQIKENGYVVKEYSANVENVVPRGWTMIRPDVDVEKKAGCEYFIDFVITAKQNEWYSENDVISHAQFALSGDNYANYACCANGKNAVAAVDDADVITLSSGNCEYVISKKDGIVISAKKDGRAYILPSMTPCFTRPRTGIDCQPGWGWWNEYRSLEDANADVSFADMLIGSSSAKVIFNYAFAKNGTNLGTAKLEYTIHPDGGLQIFYDTHILPVHIPRIGLEIVIPAGFENLAYYGRGSNESYSDRTLSAPLGVYESTVEAQHFAFIPPSENGGHEGCRWLTVGDNGGAKVKITGETPFHFDIHHSTIDDYKAGHEHELVKREESYLHIDAAHSQIGSEMSWSTSLDETLNIGGKKQNLTFKIELI